MVTQIGSCGDVGAGIRRAVCCEIASLHRFSCITPDEALLHIGRQPWRNAKDDRCNLPALL